MRMRELNPHGMRIATGALALLLLTACSSGSPDAAREHANAQAREEALARAGDATVRATAIPTVLLGEAVAKQYGIVRGDDAVMLMVSVRLTAGAQEAALPARVTATATDLLGKRQTIAMREVRSGDFVDYVGTATVIAPDTLRFDIAVDAGAGRRATLQFNRDFFPR